MTIFGVMRSLLAPSIVGIIVGAVLVALTGCASSVVPASTQPPPAGESTSVALHQPRQLGPAQFADITAEPTRVTINVHVPYEGDIPGTDLAIPFDQIAAHADVLPPGRTTLLAVYCRSGRMSQIAATTLATMGYQDVVELAGGTLAWEKSGRTLVWR